MVVPNTMWLVSLQENGSRTQKCAERTQWEDRGRRWSLTGQGERPQKKLTLATPWSQTSSFHNCEKIDWLVCCLSLLVWVLCYGSHRKLIQAPNITQFSYLLVDDIAIFTSPRESHLSALLFFSSPSNSLSIPIKQNLKLYLFYHWNVSWIHILYSVLTSIVLIQPISFPNWTVQQPLKVYFGLSSIPSSIYPSLYYQLAL